MSTYLVLNTGGKPELVELKNDELVLAIASLGRRSFVRIKAGSDLVLRLDEEQPPEAA